MQTEEDPELTIEFDADGYRVDHRSETEQSSQSKEVHEYRDRTEIRLRDEKEVRLEEVKTRETTRQATYEDIIALLDAQLDGLDEIQTSREVTIQEFNRVETTRETVTDGELRREIRTTDEKRKEEILEGPSDSRRVVTMETETVTVQPSPGALSLQETESPLSQVSDVTASSYSEQPRSLDVDSGFGTEPLRKGFGVGVTPGEAEFRIRSEGLGGKSPEKTQRDVAWISKQSPTGGSENLRVPGEIDLAENTGSLHRIQHRSHRIEELIVEDVDTFYEDQTKPAKRLSGLLGVRKERRGKSQSPTSTLEKRPKRDVIQDPTVNEGRLEIEVDNVTPAKSSPDRPAPPAGVSISAVPRSADIVFQPDVQVSGLSDKPRGAIVDPQDGNTNRITYVVSYDYPGGVNIRDSGKRKKDVHPKKKKDKRRLGKQQPETDNDMPAGAEFVTYVVNYDRTKPLDGDSEPPRSTVVRKPEGSYSESSIPKEPQPAENATIEVDMNAGEVKVMHPAKAHEERHGDTKTFVVNYEKPAVEKSAKTGKRRKEVQDVGITHLGSRPSPNNEVTYVVNYGLPSATSVVPPASTEMHVEPPGVDFDLQDNAPVYSITVVEPGPGVSVEKERKNPEKPDKKKDRGSKEAVELTYIVNYDDQQQGSTDDTDNLPQNDRGTDVWTRPIKPTIEEKIRGGKENITAKPAKQRGVPGTTESLTYVVEYEKGAEEKSKPGVKKLKKGSSSDDVVEKMYTYIVNYDRPAISPWNKDIKKKEKKGRDVKVKEPHLQKSNDIEQPSQELSFTVQHHFPEPVPQPVKPTPELSIAVKHRIPEPTFERIERNEEFSITVDHPFPEPVTKPKEQFEEFSITVDQPSPERAPEPDERFEEFSIAVDHQLPEPVTKPEEHFEEFSITVDHPLPEPIPQPEEHIEEFSITVDHPLPEPIPEPEEHIEEFSITVDHPLPELIPEPEEHIKEFSIIVDHPFPEPIPEQEEHIEEFFMAVDHPFPEPFKTPEEEFKEFSIAVDHPIPEPVVEPEEYFEEYSVAVDHPFPEPVAKSEAELEKLSITVDHPIPEAHHKIKKPLLPQLKLPEPIPPKDFGESLTYVVTYDKPIGSGEEKATKTKKKRKPLFSKGSRPSAKAEIGAKISPDVDQTFTYIVNYDEPSIGYEHSEEPKPVRTEAERFHRAEVRVPKLEIDTSSGISGPEEATRQSGDLSISVTHPMPRISRATPAAAPQESAEGITYIVQYEEPLSVGSTGDKRKNMPRKKADLKAKKLTETEVEIEVLPEESAMPLPTSDSGLTIVVEHPEPKARKDIGDISGRTSATADTFTYIVNYDKPIGKAQKVGIDRKKARPVVEVDTSEVTVNTREPIVVTPDVPVSPSANESLSFTVIHEQPELPEISSAAIAAERQWKAESSEEMTFVVDYDLPSKKEQEDELAEIEIEAPATIEISPSRDIASLELREVQPSPTPEKPQTDISVKIKTPDIPAAALGIPEPAGESVTYIVQYEEPTGKTIGKKVRGKGKAKEKDLTLTKEKLPFGADIEVEGAPLSTTYEVSVTTDERKPEVPTRKPEISTVTPAPTLVKPKKRAGDATTEQVTFIVNYDAVEEFPPVPEVRDPVAIEAKAGDMPQIEPFEIPEPKVEIQEESLGLTITGEEPLPDEGVEVELPQLEIRSAVKKPVASIAVTPDIVLPKGSRTETFTYVVTHEEPAIKPGKKEKNKRGKKISKDVKADERPEVTAGIAGDLPIYEVTVKTEQPEPSTDFKKKSEVAVATPEATSSILKVPEDFKVHAQTQPQSITYVVNYDDALVIPKSKIKGTTDKKVDKIVAPKVKPPKAPKGAISAGEGESMTYVVTYNDVEKFVPPPKLQELETLEFQVHDIHEIKSPAVPQIAVDTEEISSEFTIIAEQTRPEISAEVNPPTPEILVKKPYEVEQLTITVEQPVPEVSSEIKPVTPKIKVKAPSEVEQLTIAVTQPLLEVSTEEVKLPTPEVKVKQPTKAVVKPLSVKLTQAGTPETITYVVTYDEPTLRVSDESRSEKKDKKTSGLSFPKKKIAKKLKNEGELEIKAPEADMNTAIGVPIYEVTVITEKPTLEVHTEATKPEVSVDTSKLVKQAPSELESLTYVVTYDDVEKISPTEIKEPAAIEIQTTNIPHEVSYEIPEAEFRLEEPRTELTIAIEHPLPEISAEVKAPTPELSVRDPSEFVVQPPAFEIPKAIAAETITYIVTHEEPAIKSPVGVKTGTKEKKKRGLVLPGMKDSKGVKKGADRKVEGPEATTQTVEGVPVYEVSVTTEQLQPSVDVKKAELPVAAPGATTSITKPSVAITTPEYAQSQSVTYVVTYDTEASQTSGKKKPARVKVEARDVPKIKIPEIPDATLEVEEPSSRLTIRVEQPLPEIAPVVKFPTTDIEIREPSDVEQFSVTVEEPLSEISTEVKPPTPKIEIREPTHVEQLTITVEQPIPKVSTEAKHPIPDVRVKKPTEVVVGKPSVELTKEGTVETITYIVTQEDRPSKIPAVAESEKKDKKTKIRLPGKLFSKTYKYKVADEAELKKPTEEVVTYVVTYDDLPKAALATEISSPEIPASEFRLEEPDSQLSITVEQPLPEIRTKVKPTTPEIKIRESAEIEELTITVEEPASEIIAEFKPPTTGIKIREPSDFEQMTIRVEQPIPEVSTEVKHQTPDVRVKIPSEFEVRPPSVELPRGGTAETVTYIVTHEDQASKLPAVSGSDKKEKKPRIRFPGKYFSKTYKYKVADEAELKDADTSQVKKGKQKSKSQVVPKAKKPAIESSTGEVITYVVTYDDLSKTALASEINPPEIPELDLKIPEPDSQLSITVEQPLPEIHAEVKPPTPKIAIREPAKVEQLTIEVEEPVAEISSEVKSPTTDIKIREPSDFEQLTITVEQPIPEVSTEVKLPIPDARLKKPSEVVVGPPSVKALKGSPEETITYIVTHEDQGSKISAAVGSVKKEQKSKIRFPGKFFSKTYKYKVADEAKLKEPEISEATKGKEKRKPQAVPKAKRPAIEPSTGEVVTYVVTYDDLSKTAPATEINLPEIPELDLKINEPDSELSITVERPLPGIHAEVKPPTPEIKIREPVKIEKLTVEVEEPVAEISSEVKPPTTDIKIREPSDFEQLTITVEQPIPEVSTEVKLPTPDVRVKKPSKAVIGLPSVELPKGGTAETITYIVTHEDQTSKIPAAVEPPKNKEKKSKISFPGKYFGKKHKVNTEAELKEPKVSDITKGKHKPKPQADFKAKTPAIESSTGEVVTYVVTYDGLSKSAPAAEATSPEIPERQFKIEKPESQLTIAVEQPLPEISSEVRPPIPEITIRDPIEVEQFTITVEQPLPEISSEVRPPTPEIRIRDPIDVEQLTITIEQPLPEISSEIKPPTPEFDTRQPSENEQLTITVDQPLPEISGEVKPPSPVIKLKEPGEVEQLSITVERPLVDISAEAKPPASEYKIKTPSKITDLPGASTTETVTYTITREEPTLKVSGDVKPAIKERKPAKISVPDKRVAKELKSAAGIAATDSTTEVTNEIPIYEVTVTTEQPGLHVTPAAIDVSGAKGADVPRDAVETITYVIRHEKEPQAKEAISAEGQKKRRDWIWRVKKPAESIDISTESQEREAVRIEPEVEISAKLGEPKLGISAEAETPGIDVSIPKGKARPTKEISRPAAAPETHTYVVTYDEPQATKGKLKLWPFWRKAPAGKLEAKHKPKKNKWTMLKKKQPKVVKPRVDIELADIKAGDVTAGETARGDIDVRVPAAPSIALERRTETIAGDVSGTVVMPGAPEFSVTASQKEPSAALVIAPIPEAGDADLERRAQKPADVSQVKFDVEAKLPGRKEQILAEKVISSKTTKFTDAEAERAEPRDKADRSVIAAGGGRREEEKADEETVVYIVTYEQPFGSLTRPRDGDRETPGLKTTSTDTDVAVDRPREEVTNIKHSVQVQMPQLERCILVPIRDESSPEDSFYGNEAPVPGWPPVDEPPPLFEEDIRPADVARAFETANAAAADDRQQLPPHLVVVAVDFGTTFSGYAFSFSRDSAGSIHVMRKWEGGDPGAVDHKTPTILLLTPGGQFHSFGFTARDFYHDLSPKEAARWLYFEKFKMALHFNAELNTETKLAAANGQCVPAIDVFTHALRFFRRHVLQEVSDQVSTEVLNEDIYWIITVPAIWTEEAKQFMRLAAYRAGIASPNYPDQLLISLEPEAASIYVRKQRLHQLVPEVPFQRRRSCRRSVTPEPTAVNQPIVASDRRVLPTDSGQLVKTTTTVTVSWPVVTTIPQTDITVGHQVDTAGTRYMVVDCGGGTVDITVHEIQSRDGTLRELHRATGGPFGSVAVDQEFEKLLVEIFGNDFIDVFKTKRPAGWVDLLMAFESRKRAANPYNTKPLNVSLPFSFIDYHKKYRNCPVEHAIRKYGNRDIRWSSQGMLRLMPEAMNRLFLPAIDKIKETIGNVLNVTEVRGLRFLFLVGGFADSPMLQVAIRQEFGHLLRIIIPNDASISILKGAVCFGLDPSVITTRKSRMTYGVGVLNRFVPGQHPPSKLLFKDGEEWCTDVFDALVYADQSVAIGDTVLRRYTLVPGDADDVTVSKVVNIYSSDRRDVKYVTESGVTRCGTLCLTDDESKKPSAGRLDQKDREVQVRMTFGHTEIKVTAFELGTRKSVRATIDFLNK